MASTLLDPNLREEFSLPIDSFYKEVQPRPDIYSKYKLVAASHYKEKTSAFHEFLILDVLFGKDALRLRIERRPSSRKEGPQGLVLQTLSHIRITDDRISRVLPNFDAKTLYNIAIMRCPSKPVFSLSDVAAIFQMIYKFAPNYVLHTHQCYWFCHVFLEGVRRKVKVVETKGKDYDRRGQYKAGVAIQVVREDQVGKDIEEYNEGLKRSANEADAREKLMVKEAYQKAVGRQKDEGARTAKHVLDAVTPFLQTSEARRRTDGLAVRSTVTRLVAGAVEKEQREKPDPKEKIRALLSRMSKPANVEHPTTPTDPRIHDPRTPSPASISVV